MRDHGLVLHIISPKPFIEYKNELTNKFGEELVLNNIVGYYEGTLIDVFPYKNPNERYASGISSETTLWHDLRKIFFTD